MGSRLDVSAAGTGPSPHGAADEASAGEAAATARDRLRVVGIATLVLLMVAGVYTTTLGGTFVWDDRELILRAPTIEHFAPISFYFSHPFWQESNVTHQPAVYYRPLVTLSYALDRCLHGQNPAGFHLTNVAWHLTVCALVFALARRRASVASAGIITLIFGLMPRLSECVAWISGRTDPMATAFSLAAFYVRTSRLVARRVLALPLVALGLGCKEVALAAVVALGAYELREARGLTHPARRLVVGVGPLLVLTVGYLVLLRIVLGGGAAVQVASLGPILRAQAVLAAVGTYSWLIVNPFQPRTQIGLVASPWAPAVVAGVLVGVGLAIVARSWVQRASAGSLALLAAAAAALFPVLHVIPLPYEALASDRFLYLPLAAGLVALSPVVDRALARRTALTGVLAGALALALGTRTELRCLDWNDEVRFWAEAVRTTRADNTLPIAELGNVYYRAKMYEDAARAYGKALRLMQPAFDPSRTANVLSNIANALAANGDYGRAARLWDTILTLQPDVARNWYDRALLELHVLDFSSTRTDVARALALAPGYSDARDLSGRIDELERGAARLLSLEAQRDSAVAALTARAHLFERLGRLPDAAGMWTAVARSADASSEDLETAAQHLVANGPLDLASDAVNRWRERGGASASFDEAETALEDRRAMSARLAAERGLLL